MFVTIPLLPNVVRDESELAAKPFYIDSLNMRSVNGKMETKYGQELATSSALTGICRGGLTWADLSRTAWAAFGTHLRVQVMDQDGTLSDITPVIERGELSSAFSTTNGSTLITVTDDAHNLAIDQKVTFPGTSTAANLTINGSYVVSTVPSSSAFGFIVSSTANQTLSGTGPAIIDYEYHLKPGNQSNLGGLGFGTGGFGSGGFGSPATSQDLDARTHSMVAWGQNLIVNPNWGAIYEWAPNTSASEIVSAGDFSSTSTWVTDSGWAIGSGTSSASAGTDLTQAVTLSRSAWHLLDFDTVRNSGTIVALIGTSTVAVVSSTVTTKATFFSPSAVAQTLKFSGGGGFNGRIDNVSIKVLTTASQITGSPSSAGSVFVTAERNLVACGATKATTGLLDPMHVRWSDSEDNQDWVASAANVAGSYTLSHGSRIVRGMAGNRENLIFTDTAVYRMRSVPDPSVVYAFDLLGEGCGLIGPNAVVQGDGVFHWVSPQQKFYQYAGGGITPLNNPSERDFRDNLADVQGSKIFAYRLAARSDAAFTYPDERDGIECSREHVYNYMTPSWVSGPFARTTYLDAGVFPFPIAVDPDGRVFFQEKDFSSDGSARTTMLETSYFNVGPGSGELLASIWEVRPDFDNLQGGAQITFFSKLYPQDTMERTYGPYNITANTKRISVRIKGRQIKYRITTNDAPSFYRVGDFTFDLKSSGQKK